MNSKLVNTNFSTVVLLVVFQIGSGEQVLNDIKRDDLSSTVEDDVDPDVYDPYSG
jgi:hypothetical protein